MELVAEQADKVLHIQQQDTVQAVQSIPTLPSAPNSAALEAHGLQSLYGAEMSVRAIVE